MKMTLYRVGGPGLPARVKDGPVTDTVLLLASMDDCRTLRAFEGLDVDVEIKPVLKFAIGDKVHYSSIIGEPPTLRDTTIADGPFVVGGTLCWIAGKSCVVAQDALTAAA